VDQMLPAPPQDGAAGTRSPVFTTVDGGLHRLPAALAEQLAARGARILTGTLARELHREPGVGYAVVTGPRPSPTTYRADRVVLALPPAAAARLLAQVAPGAADLLAGVETASMAVLTLAYRSEEL